MFMMSSFIENCVFAGTESEESLAQKTMLIGTGGVADNGASDVHAPSVDNQLEGVGLDNQANPDEVMNGGSGFHAPMSEQMVYQAEGVVSGTEEVVAEVMNASGVGSAQAGLEAVVQVVVAEVVANDGNRNNDSSTNLMTEVLVNSQTTDQNNRNDNSNGNNEVVGPGVVSNLNEVVIPCVVGNQPNEVVTLSVVSNLNSGNQVVIPSVVGQSNSNEVLIPSVVGNQPNDVSNLNSNGGNEAVILSDVGNQANSNGSNDPSVVNYQNNGIGNNALATNSGVGEAMKRKRGRPRKFPISEASTVPVSSPSMVMQSGGPVMVNPQVQGSSEKRGRGRPAGSGKKHKADKPFAFAVSPAITGLTGAGFIPYIITVRTGEYVMPKLLALSQVDKQVVCVLSATGTISNVTLQQPSSSGGTVTYQGHFDILSLSGSFLLLESGGQRNRTGGLSVSLAVPNGCIFGGGVGGPLIAGSDVQIIVGTFLASEQNLSTQGCNELSTTLNHVSSVGVSPQFCALLSESSGAPVSPFNHSNGGYNHGNQQPFPNVAWM